MINFKEEIKKDMRESGFNVHKRYNGLSVPELQDICKTDQNPFAVCALSITGDLNIGSMIRTASLYGAEKFIVFGRRRFDRRGVVGASNYIEIETVEGLNINPDGTATLNEDTFWSTMVFSLYTPIFVEQGGKVLGDFNWLDVLTLAPNKPCFVFGHENRGIPENIIDQFPDSLIVSIPQRGVIRSHNVSVASGIVMHDMCKGMGWV